MSIVEFLEARIAEDEAGPGAEREYMPGSLPWPDEITVSEGRYYHRGEDITDGFTEWLAGHHLTNRARRVLAECQAKRAIIAQHQEWPVLAEEGPPSLEQTAGDTDNLTFRMSQQMAWMTTREYVVRFGTEPPTAPILRHLAAVYAEHEDYRKEWRL